MTSCNPSEEALESRPPPGSRPVDFGAMLERVRSELAAWSPVDPEPDTVLLEYQELAKWGLVDPETLPR